MKAIAQEQARQEKIGEAKQTITAIRDSSWKNQALKAIAQEQARQGKIEEAKQTITAIRDSSWKDQALTAIAIEQVRQEDVKGARETINSTTLSFQQVIEDLVYPPERAQVVNQLAERVPFFELMRNLRKANENPQLNEGIIAFCLDVGVTQIQNEI